MTDMDEAIRAGLKAAATANDLAAWHMGPSDSAVAAFRRSLAARGWAVEQDWQPIETAPKDGRNVILAMLNEEWVCEGYYEEDEDRGWFMANTHWTDAADGQVYPSHWRPLPAAPAARPDGE